MGRRWWKAYFFFALAITFVGLALPFFTDLDLRTVWWEWMYIPLYAVQLVGLFGFVYLRQVGVARIWQIAFIASVAYEIWNASTLATDPDLHEHASFMVGAFAAGLLLELPMLIGLYLYGFRCKELWRGAT